VLRLSFNLIRCLNVESTKGKLGYTHTGQLGHGDRKNRTVPTEIGAKRFSSHRGCVVLVACGGDMTAAVTNLGALWTFGNGELGQLGHTDTDDRYAS